MINFGNRGGVAHNMICRPGGKLTTLPDSIVHQIHQLVTKGIEGRAASRVAHKQHGDNAQLALNYNWQTIDLARPVALKSTPHQDKKRRAPLITNH